MRDGPRSVFGGGFVAGGIGALSGQEGRVWWGHRTYLEDRQLGARQFLSASMQIEEHTAQPGASFYPRSCREHTLAKAFTPLDIGSSPRIRGTLFVAALGMWLAELTPAHTGNATTGA